MPRSAAAVTASLSQVPPFPPVAAKLLALLSNDSVELPEVAELIGSDATFTARLLQRVNSAEFGLSSEITSVKQAVALLGTDLTRKIVLAHATAGYAKGALGTEELRRCWQHTMATAVLADEIAQACNEFTAAAFTAGIVHDIGRLGLLVAYPQDYERLIRDAAERCLDLLDFENEEFGMDHAAAGRMLAERWGLPSEMAAIAGRHHDPTEGTELSLLRIVHVACRVADTLGFYVVKPLREFTLDEAISELPERARKSLHADAAEFRSRIERTMAEYDSQPSALPPEETLALLSPDAPETNEVDTAIAAPAPAAEALEALDSPELEESEKPKPLPLIWAFVAGLVLLAAVISFFLLKSR